jgi:hypothetical protein
MRALSPQRADRVDDTVYTRNRGQLKGGAEGKWNVCASNTQDRPIEPVKSPFLDHRGQLSRDSVTCGAFVYDDGVARFLRRLDESVCVEGIQGANVDYFSLDSLASQDFSSLEGKTNHAGGRHECDVCTLTLDVGNPKRDDVVVLCNGPDIVIHHLVFEEQYGIVVANGAFQQAFGIGGTGGDGNLQPGDMSEQRV